MIKQLIIDGKKSYEDFGLLIASRNITPPKKKTIKESIPFSNVVYDFSKINGEIYWEERTLEYTFDIAELSTEEMEVVKTNAYNWLLNIHDEDIYDPYIGDYHFHGSYNDGSWIEDFGAGTISVSFTVYPYKISNAEVNVIEEIGVSDGVCKNSIAGNVGRLIVDGKSVQEEEPTPDTPVEIKSLGDNKNLWSLGNQDNLSGDIEFLLTSGDYVLSFIKSRISNSTITNNHLYRYVYIKFYDENDTLLSTTNDATTIKLVEGQSSDRQYIKFTAPENTTKIIVNFGNNNGDNNRNTNVIDIKIEEGSIGTVYSEYGYGGLEVISTGKNLLNIYEVEENTTDIYEVLDNDWIHYANTSGSGKRIFFKKFKVKPNTTYYLNYELEEGQGEDITFLYQYDEDGKNSIMQHYPSSSIFVTTLENTKYIKIGVTTQSQTAIDDYKVRLMFVESNVADNVYEPYRGNKVTINTSEVCSINDIKEELIINGNSAKIKKKFAKLILTGNEPNYSLVTHNSNDKFIQMNLFLNPANVDSRNAGSYVLSTHFTYKESVSSPNKTSAGFRSYDKNVLVFSIPVEIATDVATWKQYLKDLYSAGNPVIIYYLLNEYYDIELEDVSSIPTYKGSTTINIDTNLETTFEVGYYEPAKTMTINNNSSHRIAPTITSTGNFTIELNGVSYGIGEGIYNGKFYLESGSNTLKLTGYGSITFSYVEELF